jgi:Phycobilisome degradation protein nblA
MIDLPLALTLEQQFELKKLESDVLRVPQDQAQEMIVELIRQLMVKNNVIKHLLKKCL